jgi:hypothetical protein
VDLVFGHENITTVKINTSSDVPRRDEDSTRMRAVSA